MIDDPVPEIRKNAYNAILNLSEFRDGAEHVLKTDVLGRLVDKLLEEKVESILNQVLLLIKKLLYGQGGTEIILET